MILLAGISFAIFFVEIHGFYKKWDLNYKPFNCASCLAAWTTGVMYFMPAEVVYFTAMFFGAGCLTPVLIVLINKLWR
jgi:hypothetical protein